MMTDMTALGLAINANGAVPDAAEYAALGVGPGDWVRTAVQGSIGLLGPAIRQIPDGVNMMVSLNNECHEVGWDWSGWESTCNTIAQVYAERVKIVGCGNELDLWHLQPPVGEPDPRLTPEFAADLVKRAAPILRPAGIKVAITSVASGSWFNYLAATAASCIGHADYADLHLYMKRVNNTPNDPNWQNASEAILQARNATGLPVICSEAGIKVDDAGGLHEQADWAVGLDNLPAELICYWCWSDRMASPGETGGQAFGARGLDGQRKPVWFELQHLFGGPVNHPPPDLHPTFQLGFAEWAAKDGMLLGTPLENERGGVPGFSVQKTNTGRLMACNLIGRGWTLTFWRDSDGSRWLYTGAQSEQIA